MSLTNLLSFERRKELTHEYLLRLGAVCCMLGALLVLIHGALLLPTYLYLSEEVKTQRAHLEGIASSLQTSEGKQLSERLTTLSKNAEALVALASGPSASEAVRSVLAVSHTGVRLGEIALTLPETGEGQMRISGIASTRESLRSYHNALKELPSVSKAELPLSVYAEESDLLFSITLTGSFAP